MAKTIVVFIPLLGGVGHLLPTLEFAERLLDHRHDIAIHVLGLRLPSDKVSISSVMAAHPRLHFAMLPVVDSPLCGTPEASLEKYLCDFIAMYSDSLRNSLLDIQALATSQGGRVGGLVLDYFCSSLIDVANELSLPSYLFFTSCAGFLRFMQWLPSWDDHGGSSFVFSDSKYRIPGFRNTVPINAMPSPCFNSQGGYATLLSLARRFNDAKGIVINTFSELESYALGGIDVGRAPLVYDVGPVINFKGYAGADMEEHKKREAMEWLEEQPDSSVVFVCFGSVGAFPSSQVREIAEGIERSGFRFLWSLRVPLKESGKAAEEMLPLGFMERVKGRGLICGWVKQVDVLGHRAIGGFLSHCGWNSVLESVWHGVPQATLPIFADQRLTAFEMVKEVGIAVELKIEDAAETCFATAEEVERALVALMDEHCQERKTVREMSVAARKTVKDGGSSFSSLAQFVSHICEF